MPATDKFRYNLKTMHVVFAVSCVGIFLATIAMMWKDHADDWRQYQAKNFELAAEMQKRDLKRIQSGDYKANKEKLEAAEDAAQESLAASEAKLAELGSRREDEFFQADKLARELKAANAERDKARADYDLGVRDELPEDRLKELMAIFEAKRDARDALEKEWQGWDAKLEDTKKEISVIRASFDEVQLNLKKLDSDIERINKTLENIDPSGLSKAKRWSMTLPILDGFNSHMKIVQDWLPDLTVTLGMSEIARFDRCRTCHQNIDTTAAGNTAAYPHGAPASEDVKDWVAENKFPHPYSTHPNHELYAASSSPHPVAKFGCTICHDGQGSGTSFGNAEHTPNDPHQFEEWHHDYRFHPNHYWELPMQPKRFIESGCIKCHHQVAELGVNPEFGESAPKVYKGWMTIRQYGCFGCHEIHGYDGDTSIGPDLRLEPNYGSVASQMMTLLEGTKGSEADEARLLLDKIHAEPLEADDARHDLKALLDAKSNDSVFPKGVTTLASALKDVDGVAGTMRKVGPSFRRIADKTSKGWVEYWTENPQNFRPSTRMPRFYDLTNQTDQDAQNFETIELAGLAEYLFDKSVPLDTLKPAEGYTPNVERGKQLFSDRGCLACHSHDKFQGEGADADFGPDLSKVYEKTKRDAGNKDFSSWLYTWIKDPERYHERTRMPNLYLTPYEKGGETVDPAADIAAWLLSAGPAKEYKELPVKSAVLDDLVTRLLSKSLKDAAVATVMSKRQYPATADAVKGDEVELATADGSAVSPDEWERRKLLYVGRKTISKYGCYGCHDVPGFETARPIGAALQDWGRKDTSKLAHEHIAEWLHHHGEADGSSTHDRVEEAIKKEASGDFTDEDDRRKDLSTAYFYQSLGSHGRAGFIWQKLRQPRSYDFEKVATKGYDERLRMPKFPFDEDDIEAVATFVLGLVAVPPSEEYIYKPSRQEHDRIEGEKLLAKYNCTGCHLVELPEVTIGVDKEALLTDAQTIDQYIAGKAGGPNGGYDLLMKLKPPRSPFTGKTFKGDVDGEIKTLDVIKFHGQVRDLPDEEEDLEAQFYGYNLWETLDVGDGKYLLPKANMLVPVLQLEDGQASVKPGRGGEFAEWLSGHLAESGRVPNRERARQMSPPPLYLEGQKVQTQWLYEFLLEPEKLRFETVLRMPRFNMSRKEARTLANYFAAADGTPYPYQEIPPRDRDYLTHRTDSLRAAGLLSGDQSYLDTSWDVLTGKGAKAELCSKCHSVAGSEYKAGGTDDIRGPNLQHAARRLRPDWLSLWIHNPQWVTPYTSMPINFKPGGGIMPHLFKADAQAQVIGVRDALLNYDRIMEEKTALSKKAAPPKEQPETNTAQDAAE